MMLTQLLLIASLVPQSGEIQVEGLREGERFRAVASSAVVNPYRDRYGRVVDASTGRPVEDAIVETWTEEISGPGQGFHLVGHARTGVDGFFRVSVLDGQVPAEKIRVRAPGYLTSPGTLGDLELIHLMPKPEWTTRVRVLDFHDEPIEGAIITSTYSCAHDVPAFEVRTNANGIAELPEYGLQDRTGELRVRAEGYSARKYIDWTEVPADIRGKRPAVVHLARQRPQRARMLSRDGTALSEATLHVVDGDGFHAPRTDDQGMFEIPSRYDSGEVTMYQLTRGKDGDRFVFAGRLPSQREVEIRTLAHDWPEETPVGFLMLASEQVSEVPVTVIHADGWAETGIPLEGLEFPAGKILVLVGGAFTGYEEQLLELELLEDAELELPLSPVKEVELEVLAPAETHGIVVQAGEQSIELRGEESQTITVPAGRELVIMSEGERNRREVHPGIREATTINLCTELCLMPETRYQVASRAVPTRVEVSASRDVEARLGVDGFVNSEIEEHGAGRFTVSAPRSYPLLLCYSAEGFADLWKSVNPSERSVQFDPVKLASLAFDNQTGQEIFCESIESDSLSALHPGPFSLLFRLADGRRGRIVLDLEPGEQRVLTLRN